jgi:membrane protease YdiL (CAAX protease family)
LLDGWSGAQFLVGVLYGGITEEIVMRWGLLSGVLWGLLRLFGSERGIRRIAAWAAIGISAAAFAAGHLPAVLMTGEITPPLLLRTLGLNFALGLAFGAAFLRYHIEAAIALHAGFHVGIAAAAIGAGSLVH